MRSIRASRFAVLLQRLSPAYDVFAPVETDGASVLRRVETSSGPPDVAFNAFRTPQTLRSLWLQPAKVLAEWTADGPRPGPEPRPRLVVGAKACDLVGLAVLDRVLAGPDFREPAYVAARERNFIIAGDCTSCAASCFCTLVGGTPWPTSGFDLSLSPSGGGFLVEAGSEKGRKCLEANADLLDEASPGAEADRDKRRAEVREKVDQQNEAVRTRAPQAETVAKHLKTRLWGELAATCVECSGCNYNCPTCYCFLVHEGHEGGGTRRVSVWDSCFHAGYSRMAGGGTPRLQLTERFKNHYFHKFVWFPEVFGLTACSGCGRCVDACMGRIDKRKCLHSLETRWIPTEVLHEL